MNGLSNYPPGVTGREDYFGPRWEGPMDMRCSREATLPVLTVEMRERIGDAINGNIPRKIGLLVALDHDLPTVDVICPFEGEVDVSIFTFTMEWTCPVCGYEHSEPLPDQDES
jgi:hypothetical protein